MNFVNLFKERIDKRNASLPRYVQNQLKAFQAVSSKDYQFNIIQKSQDSPREGDVFIFSPQKGLYLYGKVLQADIKSIDSVSFNHKHVIVLFHQKTFNLSMDDYSENYEDLLTYPMIVGDYYWQKGFFYTIGNRPLSFYEKKLSIGFYKIHPRGNVFCTATGSHLEKEADILGLYAISTITGVAAEVNRELIRRQEPIDIMNKTE